MKHLREISARSGGFHVYWDKKDHRLLRTCKVLTRHGYLRCSRGTMGLSIFHATEKWLIQENTDAE